MVAQIRVAEALTVYGSPIARHGKTADNLPTKLTFLRLILLPI